MSIWTNFKISAVDTYNRVSEALTAASHPNANIIEKQMKERPLSEIRAERQGEDEAMRHVSAIVASQQTPKDKNPQP